MTEPLKFCVEAEKLADVCRALKRIAAPHVRYAEDVFRMQNEAIRQNKVEATKALGILLNQFPELIELSKE